jgi:hypothetical protein
MSSQLPYSAKRFFRSRLGLASLGFLAVAAFFLITEHTAHLYGILPYTLLLLCPLLHFLHGHGDHNGHDSHQDHGVHAEHDHPVRDK